ncbi:unnamed protein product, partial [Rotaria sp. Silwood1]
VKKLKYLIVKCMINYDFQLYYLKWMLDNLSHVRKVKLRLKINGTGKKDPVINESLVDANFVRSYDGRTDQNRKRARLLAHLLSMPLQLNYLRIQQFQWLLHVIAYTSDELLKNALKNVRYAEFCLTSCHFGSNQSIGIGKFLVLVLSNYMPHLQALRLWRPGDFPWTTRVLFTVQKALPILVDGGSIIRIGSASSIKGHPTAGVYSESKAAIRSFAQWWTIDLKEQKIHVNTLSPGSVETAMCRSVAHSEVVKTTFVNNLIATVPMDPIDTPDEIAKAVVFLASEDSSYVTGIELLVDGGRGLT